MEPWIQTAYGIEFQLLEPTPEMIDVRDIAHALAHQCRYTGHVRRFFSVAQHSLLVADILRAMGHSAYDQLCGLLHDASETYLSDLASPWKQATPLGPIYGKYETRIMECVADKFHLHREFDKGPLVKMADRYSLLLEAKYLMGNPAWAQDGTEMGTGYYPLPKDLWDNAARPTPAAVKAKFIRRYDMLVAQGATAPVAA